MNPETIFSLAGFFALGGWLLLALFPKAKWASTYAAGRVIPLGLAVCYLTVLLVHGREAKGGFNSLAQVAELFGNQWALLAGWVHYLAFDLFIGAWETRDANERGIRRIFVLPCLFLTFMLGPVGLLCYFGVRSMSRPVVTTPDNIRN